MGIIKELVIDKEGADEILKLSAYVKRSTYRLKCLLVIGDNALMPTEIANRSGIRINHMSNVLKQLKSKEMVVCINEEVTKGRLYKLTRLGLLVYKNLIGNEEVEI